MMLYGLNKKILFAGLDMLEFVNNTKKFVSKYFINDKYIFRLEDTGYITIINKISITANKQLI